LKARLGGNHESALMVRVAEANDPSFRAPEQGECLARPEDVIIFIEWRAVNNLKALQLDRAGGKALKETKMLGRELIPGPLGGKARQGVESRGDGVARTSPIVIAANDDRGQGPYLFNHGIGVGTVTDQIAQAQDLLVLSLRQLEAHLQRFQIGMYVAEEKIAHYQIPRWRRLALSLAASNKASAARGATENGHHRGGKLHYSS